MPRRPGTFKSSTTIRRLRASTLKHHAAPENLASPPPPRAAPPGRRGVWICGGAAPCAAVPSTRPDAHTRRAGASLMGGRRGQGPQPLAGPSQQSGGSIGITRERAAAGRRRANCSRQVHPGQTAGTPHLALTPETKPTQEQQVTFCRLSEQATGQGRVAQESRDSTSRATNHTAPQPRARRGHRATAGRAGVHTATRHCGERAPRNTQDISHKEDDPGSSTASLHMTEKSLVKG